MAGLAAAIGAPGSAPAVAGALAARGPETATWRADGLHLAVRAAMPAVHEFGRRALVIDGNASPSAIVAGYGEHGPPGAMAGPDPYAVVLADPDRDALVLARHGDGPTLYWAWHGPSVLAASEPAALLAAGVPAEPEPAVMVRFLATGACDDGVESFFAGVRRVRPGQAVEVLRDPGAATFTVRVHTATAPPPRPGPVQGRVGVRLSHSAASLAQLESTLHAPGAPHPLPVYSATFPELAAFEHAGSQAAPLLAPLVRSAAVRHRALPFFADEIDVDGFLSDLGEPTPYLDDWLLWAVARRVAGEVDVLGDAAGGAYRSRLADRVASRFGVVIRPGGAAGAVDRPSEALLPDLLRRMRTELVTTFLRPRLPAAGSGLAQVLALLAGRRTDTSVLWRRYLLERWLRCVVTPATPPRPAPRPAPVRVDGRTWTRHRLRTEKLAAGDKVPEKIAWYVGEAVAVPKATWYVLVAAKPVAAMQGRARSLWDIRPGLTARLLHRFARPSGSRQAAPWTVQAAIDEAGWWRTVVAVLARRPDPAVGAIRGPREDAVPPGQAAVTLAPAEPHRLAAEVVAALRTALPDRAYATLGGCAVVAGDQLLGWAGRPGSPGRPGAPGPGNPAGAPPAALWADDPFNGDHTPIVLVAAR